MSALSYTKTWSTEPTLPIPPKASKQHNHAIEFKHHFQHLELGFIFTVSIQVPVPEKQDGHSMLEQIEIKLAPSTGEL